MYCSWKQARQQIAYLVKRFVPDGGAERDDLEWQGTSLELKDSLVVDLVSLVFLNEIHLVDKAENLGVLGISHDGFQARLVVVHVLLHVARLDIKDINQNLHVLEDMVAL